MQFGSDTFKRGDKVIFEYQGVSCPGRISVVGDTTISVEWSDGDEAVIYPLPLPLNIRRPLYPWE